MSLATRQRCTAALLAAAAAMLFATIPAAAAARERPAIAGPTEAGLLAGRQLPPTRFVSPTGDPADIVESPEILARRATIASRKPVPPMNEDTSSPLAGLPPTPTPAYAALDVYVDGDDGSDANTGGSGDPFATIGKGVTDVSAGGTVHIRNSTTAYAEAVAISGKSMTLLGEAAGGSGGRTVTGLTGTDYLIGVSGTCTVEISNLTLDGTGKDILHGVLYDGAAVTGSIHDCTIQGIIKAGAQGNGIRLNDSPAEVHHNTIQDWGRRGISVYDSDGSGLYGRIHHNIVIGDATPDLTRVYYGIQISDGDNEIDNNEIKDCLRGHPSYVSAGILLYNFGNGVEPNVHDNNIHDNDIGIVAACAGPGTIVTGNTYSGNGTNERFDQYVGDTTADCYTSIQAAVDATSVPGTIVFVDAFGSPAGPHAETVDIDIRVEMYGYDPATAIIPDAGDYVGANDSPVEILSTAGGTIFYGFTVDGTNGNYLGSGRSRRGVYVNGADDVTVSTSTVREAVSAIPIVFAAGALVEDCTAENFGIDLNTGGGVFFYGSTGAMDGNTAQNGLATGLIFHNGSAGSSTGDEATNCPLGLLVNGNSALTTVTGGTFTGCEQGIQTVMTEPSNGDDVLLTGNTISGHGSGIVVYGGTTDPDYVTITGNTVKEAAGSVGMYFSTDVSPYGYADVHATLAGNVIRDNSYGLYFEETGASLAKLMDVTIGGSAPNRNNIYNNRITDIFDPDYPGWNAYMALTNDNLPATFNYWDRATAEDGIKDVTEVGTLGDIITGSNATATVYVTPIYQKKQRATPVSVDVVYDGGGTPQELREFSVDVTFPTALLTLTGIVEGPFLDSFGAPGAVFLYYGAGGTRTVSGAILGGSHAGATGSGVLFTMNFTTSATTDGIALVDLPVTVVLRDMGNPFNEMPSTTADATIEVDGTPPANVTDFAAAPGHNKIFLTWVDPTAPDFLAGGGVEIWRAGWDALAGPPTTSAYPEYDDLPADEPPAVPLTRAAAALDADWSLVTTVAPGLQAYTDASFSDATRNVYYYAAFARDDVFNYAGTVMSETQDRATSYFLGDFTRGPGDPLFGPPYGAPGPGSVVDFNDLVALSAVFGTCDGGGGYNNQGDIGPSNDNSSFGIPTTDNCIDFEDLILFAINFGSVFPFAPPGPAPDVAAGAAPLMRLVLPAGEPGGTFEVGVAIDPRGSTLQGARLEIAYDPAVVEIMGVAAGALFAAGGVPGFLAERELAGDPARLELDGAALGAERAATVPGLLARLTVRRLAPGDPGLAIGAFDLRDPRNRALPGEVGSPTTGIDEPAATGPALPAAFALAANHPNPFNPTTIIRYALPEPAPVRLRIWNAAGGLVRVLVDDARPAGYHDAVWDGRDDRGEALASGVYLYRLDAGTFTASRKMLLMK